MKNPIRNETSLVLVVAVIFSGVAIPVLSGFLEPSQPPAVAAVQIGDPRDDAGNAARDDGGASGAPATERPPAERRRPAPRRAAPAQPAPSVPADDADEDDGGDAD